MIQRRNKNQPKVDTWYGRASRKCHFCRLVIQAGEEWIGFQSDSEKSMHRTCLDNWLKAHPPKPEGKAKKVMSDEDAEKEFERLRRQLARQARVLRAPAKPARTARSKTTS